MCTCVCVSCNRRRNPPFPLLARPSAERAVGVRPCRAQRRGARRVHVRRRRGRGPSCACGARFFGAPGGPTPEGAAVEGRSRSAETGAGMPQGLAARILPFCSPPPAARVPAAPARVCSPAAAAHRHPPANARAREGAKPGMFLFISFLRGALSRGKGVPLCSAAETLFSFLWRDASPRAAGGGGTEGPERQRLIKRNAVSSLIARCLPSLLCRQGGLLQ